MKASNIFWGILAVFAICFINSCPAMGRPYSATQRSKKHSSTIHKNKTTQTENEEISSESEIGSGEEEVSLLEALEKLSLDEEAYINSLEGEEKNMILQANYLMQTREEKEAVKLYKQLAVQYKNALACFILGQIYAKDSSNPFSLAKAHSHFQMAVQKGFSPAIGKLLAIGKQLADLVNKPMSTEVQMMYQ